MADGVARTQAALDLPQRGGKPCQDSRRSAVASSTAQHGATHGPCPCTAAEKYSSEVQQPPRPTVTVNDPSTASDVLK